MITLLSQLCLILATLLALIAGVGLLRFPDFYARLHAVGVSDTLCAGLFLLGLALEAGWSLTTVKLGLIFLFLLFTSPTASFSLARSARLCGISPWQASREGKDD